MSINDFSINIGDGKAEPHAMPMFSSQEPVENLDSAGLAPESTPTPVEPDSGASLTADSDEGLEEAVEEGVPEIVKEFDPKHITLNEKQVECLTYIEQQFFLEGAMPTVDAIAAVFGVNKATIKRWLKSPEFDYILRTKGIINSNTDGVLTAPQMMIINMLLNIGDKRSEREKCELAGITPQKLAVWRRDAQFIGYMQKRAEKMFKDSDDIAYLNVIKNVQGGDLSAAKFYFEMTGKYQPSVRMDVNVDMILARIIEILQVRVKDPATLELIANDFDMLMGGGQHTMPSVQYAVPEGLSDNPITTKGFENLPPDLGISPGPVSTIEPSILE